MVYDVQDEYFIKSSDKLFNKLRKKKLWNKKTLIIGLDKSARPLAYTLKRISDNKNVDTPDIRFFNYSNSPRNYDNFSKEYQEKIAESLKENINPKKLSHYDKVVILDDHMISGKSINTARDILEDYFSELQNPPKIYLATLGARPKKFGTEVGKNTIIATSLMGDISGPEESGIEDKYTSEEIKNGMIQESKTIKNKETYGKFVQNRKILSDNIDFYIPGKKKIKWYISGKKEILDRGKKKSFLEKIVSGIFVLSFLAGLFLSSNSLTGNVIGTPGNFHKLIGIILILVGISGFFIYRKLR